MNLTTSSRGLLPCHSHQNHSEKKLGTLNTPQWRKIPNLDLSYQSGRGLASREFQFGWYWPLTQLVAKVTANQSINPPIVAIIYQLGIQILANVITLKFTHRLWSVNIGGSLSRDTGVFLIKRFFCHVIPPWYNRLFQGMENICELFYS